MSQSKTLIKDASMELKSSRSFMTMGFQRSPLDKYGYGTPLYQPVDSGLIQVKSKRLVEKGTKVSTMQVGGPFHDADSSIGESPSILPDASQSQLQMAI